MFSICVYCGSRRGHDPRFAEAAARLGTAIAQGGGRLVYGGGHAGLMGVVADAALAAGGQVLGVIPKRLVARELGHRGIQELRVVDTMHDRKLQMAQAADAFVALPGGLGTLEELFEAWTWQQLGYHARPIGLLDTAGFWAPLRALLHHVRDAGFVTADQVDRLHVGSEPEPLLARLREAAASAGADRADFNPV
ncbi:MAG TPA: TIGR00730 family Rossman fold protein [Burkholderiaceae bacterium]